MAYLCSSLSLACAVFAETNSIVFCGPKVGTDDVSQSLAIVIPCHNEREGLAQLIEKLDEVLTPLAFDFNCEVLLIDDGSTDDTISRMHALVDDDSRYRVLQSPTCRGIGAALRLALSQTSAEVVVNADADCTYDPRTIPQLLALLADADLVTGSPYHPDGRVLNVPGWRLALSRGLSMLYRWTSPVQVHTYTSMFRAYRREVLEAVRWDSDGFLSVTEILIGAGRSGYRVVEFPTSLDVRRFGQSKIRIFQVMRDHLRFLIRQTFRHNAHDTGSGAGLTPSLQQTHPKRKVP